MERFDRNTALCSVLQSFIIDLSANRAAMNIVSIGKRFIDAPHLPLRLSLVVETSHDRNLIRKGRSFLQE
jgi:hypothetical protein